jgi:Na+:H+ antiporter, NhaA family
MFALAGGVGGMLVPAALYGLVTLGTPFQHAWGIPVATDTAIVLSILVLFKSRLPNGLFGFLAALAIIDDIGAVLVIAICYTPEINFYMLGMAVVLIGLLLVFNVAGIRHALIYALVGLLIWATIEMSGLHGTLAGIIVALAIPARPKNNGKVFLKRTKEVLSIFESRHTNAKPVLSDDKQHHLLEHIQTFSQHASTPLQRWEDRLELPIFIIVLPLFVMVNAGIPISKQLLETIFVDPLPLGIMLGLVVGKPLGVVTFCWASLRLKLGALPDGLQFRHIIIISSLTGIGFTMSLFITTQSLDEHALVLQAKGAVLIGSLISTLLALFQLKRVV